MPACVLLLLLLLALAPAAAHAENPAVVDRAFGEAGTIRSELDGALLPLAGGALALAGSSGGTFAVERRLADGSPDPAFGTSGRTAFRVGAHAHASALATVPAGGLIAAGRAEFPGEERPALVIARYRPDGGLDATFGTEGVVVVRDAGVPPPAAGTSESPDVARGVAVQPGGRIVVLTRTIELRAFDPAGAPDPSFGDGGTARIPPDRVPASDYPRPDAIRLVTDGPGNLLVLGSAGTSDAGRGYEDTVPVLARFTPSGTLDDRFGDRGLAPTRTFSTADMAVAPDGAIATVGSRCGAGDAYGGCPLALGLLDAAGHARRDAALRPADTGATGLAVQRDGKFLVATGSSLSRATPDGAPDRGFGACGVAFPGFARPGRRVIAGVAAQDGGGILAIQRRLNATNGRRPGVLVTRLAGGNRRAEPGDRPLLPGNPTRDSRYARGAVRVRILSPQRSRARVTVLAIAPGGARRAFGSTTARIRPCRGRTVAVRARLPRRRPLAVTVRIELENGAGTRVRAIPLRLSRRGQLSPR